MEATKRYFIFSPNLASASALHGKHENTKIASFALMLYYCFARLKPVAN